MGTPVAAEVYGRLGDAIRRRRDAAGMSQASLGSRVGLGRTSITNIEKGTQSILLHQFLEIAEAIGTPAEEILREVGRVSEPERVDEGGSLAELLTRLDRKGLGR